VLPPAAGALPGSTLTVVQSSGRLGHGFTAYFDPAAGDSTFETVAAFLGSDIVSFISPQKYTDIWP
jgi:hypothetical protein